MGKKPANKKSSYLDKKVRVVARQGLGQKTFDREVAIATLLAVQKVYDRKVFVVYGD